jgi:putative colanic acid biosynthesis UDP-glucose lipid carrier transferase
MLPRGLLKEYSSLLALVLRILDISAIIIAALVAFYCKFGNLQLPDNYINALLIAAVLTPLLFGFFGIYVSIRAKGFFQHLRNLFQAAGTLIIILAGLAFLTKSGDHFSRSWFIIWSVLSTTLLVMFRGCLFLLLRYMRTHGWNERRVIILGAGELGVRFTQSVHQALWTGFRVVALFDDNAAQKVTLIPGIPVLETPANLSDYIAAQSIDEIWLAFPFSAEEQVKQVLHELRHQTITTRLLLDVFGLDILNCPITKLAGFPVLNIRSTPMMGGNRLVKALEDRILAALILLFISPIFIFIALAVKLSSPGPVFYRQKRISWNGREFDMLKFRTMPVDAEAVSGPVWAKEGEKRATGVGAFLRRTSLDELPQFLNVLRGDMSIVGPRPERMIFVEEFKDKIPGYMQKHLVKAGITGWAQINGWRGNTSLEKRIEYDLYYIENWSFLFDLKIIFLTVVQGFINKNAY